MLRMNRRLVSVVLCLPLLGATPVTPGSGAAKPEPTAAAASLDAQWGVRLLHALLIADAAPDSPAAKAGIRPLDVLVGYDTTGVDDAPNLAEFTAGMKAAAGKGPVKAKIWRLNGPARELTVELRLPAGSEARLGLAVHPTVFFREVGAGGAAAQAGVKPWDALESVEGEDTAERPRLSDFDARVMALRNKEGSVRATIGHWHPTGAESGPKIAFEAEREVTLPIASPPPKS